jgi:tetratricopeptide (TPR) repeat protein/DNA-binding CsgD family transcriptional regulator
VFAFAQLVRGEFYVDLAQFEDAERCLKDAYDRYIRLNRPLDASDGPYLLARSYLYQNNYADALQTYFDVLDLLNQYDTTFSHRRASLYREIGIVYQRSGNKQQQLFWWKKMWDADPSKMDHPWDWKANTAADLSSYYLTENIDSSIVWAKMAIDIFKAENESSPPPPRFIYKLATAYLKKGDCQTALPYFLDTYRRNTDQSNLFAYYQYGLSLGECYLCVGKLDSAEIYLNESLATPDTGNLANAYELLGDVYGKKGRYQKAWLAEKENFRLTKAKITTDRIKATADADARYQATQKAHRIQALETEQEIIHQKYFIALLLTLLSMGLLLFSYQRQRSRHQLIAQEKTVLEQEKQLLEQAKILVENNERLKTQELLLTQKDLLDTKAELDATIDMVSIKNQLIEDLHLRITNANTPAEGNNENLPDASLTSMKILTPTDWVQFQKRFEEQLPGIIPKLQSNYSHLTSAETRLFLLLKLGFDTPEIADTLGIARDSVWRSRHRLSKKLNLPDTNRLDSFIGMF